MFSFTGPWFFVCPHTGEIAVKLSIFPLASTLLPAGTLPARLSMSARIAA